MNISRLRESPVKENKTNDSTAKIGMNFEYIAINVRNFNNKADFIQIYPVSEGYLRKIPVSRTVKLPLLSTGIFRK